jgi:signal transduction histidine kinase
MRALGLRPQLLLLLGGLLVLALLPLQLALTTYTRVTLRQLDDAQVHALQATLSAHVRDLAASVDAPALIAQLQRSASDSTLVAASALDGRDERASFGDAGVLTALRSAARGDASLPHVLRVGERRLWAFAVPNARGVALLALDAERSSSRGPALIGMFGIYTFLIAVGFLTAAYFALTRFIVKPLDALAEAAQSVTLGKRKLIAPSSSALELADLGASLERMTDRLLSEEESLRSKIAEVERATAELASAQTQLVRSERLASVGRLSAGLAHEIGNPIAAMMGMADLLLDGDLAPHEQRDFVVRMRSEMERVHRTLERLLQFARPTRALGEARAAQGDVEAAIHDTAALVVHQASMRDVELGIDVFPGLPRVTLGGEQLTQVLLNLLLNAADAVQGRSGARISVVAQRADAAVRVHVEDNGPGVPAAVAEHIFEPFFTTKEVGKGTGLGLSVCQGLVSAAGGSLSLDASYSGGARFVVNLPVAADEPPAATGAA